MTRRCEIEKIGLDLPCRRIAKHFLKIVSKRLGARGKFKIWLCDKHHELISEKGELSSFLDSIHTSLNSTSAKYEGHLSR